VRTTALVAPPPSLPSNCAYSSYKPSPSSAGGFLGPLFGPPFLGGPPLLGPCGPLGLGFGELGPLPWGSLGPLSLGPLSFGSLGLGAGALGVLMYW
jgi:hypothetical protein